MKKLWIIEKFEKIYENLIKEYKIKFNFLFDKVWDVMNNLNSLRKNEDLSKIYRKIYDINLKLSENKINYSILKKMEKTIYYYADEDKKIENNIQSYKNYFLRKKQK